MNLNKYQTLISLSYKQPNLLNQNISLRALDSGRYFVSDEQSFLHLFVLKSLTAYLIHAGPTPDHFDSCPLNIHETV